MPDLPTEAEVAAIREEERECLEAVERGEVVSCATVSLLALVEAWAPIVEERAERGEDGYCHCPTGTRGKEHQVACEIETAREWRRWKGEETRD